MKNKLSKIIIVSIFLVLSSLFIGSTVKAKVNIGGTEYYTKNDVHWMTDDSGRRIYSC